MNLKKLWSKEMTKKILCVVFLLVVALLSVFVVSKPLTSPEFYESTIQSIDEKKGTVMGVTAMAATASTALAAIPGDATTPIANQIMDISSYLMIVVCALVLEKSLLTVMGYVAFKILIPVACALLGVHVFTKSGVLKIMALKLVVFALVIVSIIPFSMRISDIIYEANRTTVETITEPVDVTATEDEKPEEKSWFANLFDKAKDGITDAGEKAQQLLNRFVDVIALFIITYCALPIIIVLVVVWLVNFLFGLSVPIHKFERRGKSKKTNCDNHEDGYLERK